MSAGCLMRVSPKTIKLLTMVLTSKTFGRSILHEHVQTVTVGSMVRLLMYAAGKYIESLCP